jgi:DNA polymerase-3 subunit beta
MKLIILQEKLKEGLNIIERITSKSLTLPILNNTLIKTEKNFINLSSTDLEIAILWWDLAKIEKEGKIVVPSRLLSSFINLIPNKPINLEIENLNLIVKSENYKTQIKGYNPDDFPIIPVIKEEKFFSIENSTFCQSLSQVVDFTNPSLTKPEISGIYFNFKKDLITITATDSFRLGEKKIFLENFRKEKSSLLDFEYSFILPHKTAREILNIFGEKEGELKIYFTPNQVMFELPMEEVKHPKIQIISRLIEGSFPNYQEIIPKKYETEIILNREEFLNQVKLASLFSGKINEVKLKINSKNQQIEISSQNPEVGNYNSFLSGQIKGQSLEISFNHRFLIDGLSNLKNQKIIFELNGEEGPGVIKPIDDPGYIYLVMPIKTS